MLHLVRTPPSWHANVGMLWRNCLAAMPVLCALGLVAALPSLLFAADEVPWPVYPLDDHQFPAGEYGRGPGGYLSIFSLALYWLMFLAWVKLVDWVNRDAQLHGMKYVIWNPIVFFPFLVGFFLFALSVPYIGWFMLLVSIAAPFGAYVFFRNKKVHPSDQVLTRDHLRHFFSRKAAKVGVKVDAEKKADYQKGAPVELFAKGGADERADTINLLRSRQSPGYVTVKDILAEAIDRRAERIMLDYMAQGVTVKHQIDGVWIDHTPRDRESGDMALAVMKTISALNANERRARQDGEFAAEYKGKKTNVKLSAQGTQTGERVLLSIVGNEVKIGNIEEAGLRPKLLEQLKEICSQSKGMVLVTSMPSGGLSTAITTLLKSLDRYMRDFVAIRAVDKLEPEVENVEVVTFNPAQNQTPADVLVSVFRKDPNVIVAYDLADPKSIGMLCEQAQSDSLVIGTLRAKEAAEAPLRLLVAKVPANQLAPPLAAIVGVRLIRKLCDSCKQPYAPQPELLKKLGLPAGKVQALYRPPPPPAADSKEGPCSVCGGIGYLGRTGIYELLIVDDKFRQALIKQPKIEVLRQVAAAAGNRTLMQEGILLVARGVTSLQELQRAMQQQ